MADFCLDCFKKFEPNANEDNTILSDYLDFCEGCCEMKQIVFEFDENKKPIQIVNSIQNDFCGVQCEFTKDIIENQATEIEILKEEIKKLTNKCNDCAGCTQWKCDCSNIEIQAYEKFAERVIKLIEEKSSNLELMRSLYTQQSARALRGIAKNINGILKELVGDSNG